MPTLLRAYADAEKILHAELEALGFEVVTAQVHTQGRHCIFKAYIDTPKGITADDCNQAARRVRDVIFTQSLLPQHYQLEISSPGIDRPLTTEPHFTRHCGRRVRVECRSGAETRILEGTIVDTVGALVLETGDAQKVTIAYDTIIEGKIQLPW